MQIKIRYTTSHHQIGIVDHFAHEAEAEEEAEKTGQRGRDQHRDVKTNKGEIQWDGKNGGGRKIKYTYKTDVRER